MYILFKNTTFAAYSFLINSKEHKMKDIFDKIKANRGPLGQHAKESHGYFTFPKLEGDIEV